MTQKHTQGPWMVEQFSAFVFDQDSRRIADCYCDDQDLTDKEIEANAALIAAAPELLEALKHAVNWHDQLTPKDIARYKEAIAKAEGR